MSKPRMFAVDPDEIRDVLAHPMCATKTVFDRELLHRLIAHSFSITKDEKLTILDDLHMHSQEVIDDFIRILEREQRNFADLNERAADIFDEPAAADETVH